MTQQRRIVIAASSILRLDLQEGLVEMGHLIVGEASDGEGAVQRVRQTRPDLVILDAGLRGMDDLKLMALLASEGRAPDRVL